ncbi:TPA: nucleotidyltransferase, partial [Staphylococcus aureus]|nr:nucleotidyltransferase [Staphylococcus aureus]
VVSYIFLTLQQNLPFGVLTVNENQNITMIEEKPKIKNYISGGCYIFNKEIIKKVPKNKNLKMTDFLEKLINDNISISSYVHNGVWIDAGTWEDLKKAKSIFL